ncbi:ornithine carbamoyltransferase [Lactobacillus sp. LL6]|uniref:ornithine carbamoyltransferase n=1 Tax=Lactobacillus sp. LL6 TaxID=2596827 RepID=UPI001185D4E6|nr:ornithine carbamoyltransferase [Lactobacillus sp. LL6]TSO26718.1 ornithine carbamoyltransferase [Lactobacillus sp. LL6]
MPINLRNRNFISLTDFTTRELEYLLDLAEELKREKLAGTRHKRLEGKNIVLVFEKGSTRTRASFEIAAHDEGAHVTYFGPEDTHFGSESLKDSSRVLGEMFDGIGYRGFSQESVETLAKYAEIPVWNGLTDLGHPSQALVDFMSAKEVLDKSYRDMKFAFVGNGQDNISNSLMIGAAKMGMQYSIVAPKELWPEAKLVKQAQKIAKETGAVIQITDNIKKGVKNADVITTDVWVSMGESSELWQKRIELLKPYQVTMEMMKMTENPDTVFTHCLPAYHNLETDLGRKIYKEFGLKEMEVTDEVFESDKSIVFNGPENRIHVLRSIMVASLGV